MFCKDCLTAWRVRNSCFGVSGIQSYRIYNSITAAVEPHTTSTLRYYIQNDRLDELYKAHVSFRSKGKPLLLSSSSPILCSTIHDLNSYKN